MLFFVISDIFSMIAFSAKMRFTSMSVSLYNAGQKASAKGLKTYLFSPRRGKDPAKRNFLVKKLVQSQPENNDPIPRVSASSFL